ncbi:putative exonuclease [Lyophyllum shimeji]|uniref:Exonuclease n=1 Tax=Lyophyllum shimeji TaxID=47721 RepID=A0A9P3PG17_LYOSH|nr:putative exonuclease [Lyophyllum shimeji]
MLAGRLDGMLDLAFYAPPLRVLVEHWIICAALFAATCLLGWYYKGFIEDRLRDKPIQAPGDMYISPPTPVHSNFTLGDVFARVRRRRPPPEPAPVNLSLEPSPPGRNMRYARQPRFTKKGIASVPIPPPPPPPKAKQPYEAFLVLDVEATCQQGTDFSFPNEIIEFPVCLMRWKDRLDDHRASQLEVVEEFRSFVKPTWQPVLSQFCTELTGITQEQVDSAPLFPAVLASFQKFMIKHGLIDGETGERLVRFCWCSDGPFDVRDFVVKQCFISKIPMPGWIQGDVLDVRTAVLDWLHSQEPPKAPIAGKAFEVPRRRSLNIPAQLKALGLPRFEGRQHSGIDDTRNIAKVVAELARRGVSLYPNTAVHPNRRWQWMGKRGEILEGYWTVNKVEVWKTQ